MANVSSCSECRSSLMFTSISTSTYSCQSSLLSLASYTFSIISSRSFMLYFSMSLFSVSSFNQLARSSTLRMLGLGALAVSPDSITLAIHSPSPLVLHTVRLMVQSFCFHSMNLWIMSLSGDLPAHFFSSFGP